MAEKKKLAKGKYRLATFITLGIIELAYILGISYVLTVNDGDCDKPLRLWLKVLLLVYVAHFSLLSITELFTPYCTHFLSGKICAISAGINAILGSFMVVWFVLGNIWYFYASSSCASDFYEGEMATFVIIVVYYAFLGSTCCFGCLMVIFICLGCGITNRAADY